MVLSTSHPVSDWFQIGGSYFAVEKVTAVMDPRGARWQVLFWRMPLTVLLDEVLSAGFRLERLVEHVPPPQSRDIDARLYERLIVAAQKGPPGCIGRSSGAEHAY